MPFDPIELHLLFVCGFGVAGSAIGLFGLLFGPKRGWTAIGFLFGLMLFGAAMAAAALKLPWGIPWGLAVLGGVATFFWAVRCSWLVQFAGWLQRHIQTVRIQGLLLLLLCPAFLLWAANQTEQEIPLVDASALSSGIGFDPSVLQPVETIKAVTDRGKSITLYTLPEDALSAADLKRQEQDLVRNRELAQKQICTASPDKAYNCHGWVFAAGHFWIRGKDIPAILEDNGYHPVSVPRPGDVVVFDNESKDILHTGLVRTVTEDGLILIESKWGSLGRYIHRPEDQNYSLRWTYYQTERDGHRVQGISGDTPQIVNITTP